VQRGSAEGKGRRCCIARRAGITVPARHGNNGTAAIANSSAQMVAARRGSMRHRWYTSAAARRRISSAQAFRSGSGNQRSVIPQARQEGRIVCGAAVIRQCTKAGTQFTQHLLHSEGTEGIYMCKAESEKELQTQQPPRHTSQGRVPPHHQVSHGREDTSVQAPPNQTIHMCGSVGKAPPSKGMKHLITLQTISEDSKKYTETIFHPQNVCCIIAELR